MVKCVIDKAEDRNGIVINHDAGVAVTEPIGIVHAPGACRLMESYYLPVVEVESTEHVKHRQSRFAMLCYRYRRLAFKV